MIRLSGAKSFSLRVSSVAAYLFVTLISPMFGEGVAVSPPMGWNSFDAYDCRINEEQFRQAVDFMAERLKPYGWEYCVIDYCWFNPAPGSWNNPARRFGHPDLKTDADGRPIERLAMDSWGRLLPSPERFPSASQGRGFKPLADYVHSRGLKFGIHIMRGIPRQAYFDDTPIKKSSASAKDIAENWDRCDWCNNMFGVDATKPGAQEYYDSLFALYAKWGVDFVKADDTMVPPYHRAEIEMMRKAIDKCGRPIVLSLSCGEAPLSQAKHLVGNANMWRVSADFWDEWSQLEHAFELLNSWSSHIGPGHWPDADMIPIGRLSLGGRPHGPERESKFTAAEKQTLMTLFCIARSPLIWGGDPLSVTEEDLSYLSNFEILSVNQKSENNQQLYRTTNSACWVATDPGTEDTYVALFNLSEKQTEIAMDLEWLSLRGEYLVRDLWQQQADGTAAGRLVRDLPPHGAGLYRLTKVQFSQEK